MLSWWHLLFFILELFFPLLKYFQYLLWLVQLWQWMKVHLSYDVREQYLIQEIELRFQFHPVTSKRNSLQYELLNVTLTHFRDWRIFVEVSLFLVIFSLRKTKTIWVTDKPMKFLILIQFSNNRQKWILFLKKWKIKSQWLMNSIDNGMSTLLQYPFFIR